MDNKKIQEARNSEYQLLLESAENARLARLTVNVLLVTLSAGILTSICFFTFAVWHLMQ